MLTCVCGSSDELVLLLSGTVFSCVRGSNHTSAAGLFSVCLHMEMNISTGTACRNGACFVHHAHSTPSPFFRCRYFPAPLLHLLFTLPSCRHVCMYYPPLPLPLFVFFPLNHQDKMTRSKAWQLQCSGFSCPALTVAAHSGQPSLP